MHRRLVTVGEIRGMQRAAPRYYSARPMTLHIPLFPPASLIIRHRCTTMRMDVYTYRDGAGITASLVMSAAHRYAFFLLLPLAAAAATLAEFITHIYLRDFSYTASVYAFASR